MPPAKRVSKIFKYLSQLNNFLDLTIQKYKKSLDTTIIRDIQRFFNKYTPFLAIHSNPGVMFLTPDACVWRYLCFASLRLAYRAHRASHCASANELTSHIIHLGGVSSVNISISIKA